MDPNTTPQDDSYKIIRRVTLQGHGVPYTMIHVTDYDQLDVCQVCGKKIKTCQLSNPPRYRCSCYSKAL